MSCIRVAIVDDHTLFRAGIRVLLKGLPDIEVIGEATNGQEALKLASELHPDVLLLDLGLPDTSGITVLKEVVQSAPKSKVIVLTMHNDAAMVRASLAAGAAGYIVKTAADTELIAAIRSVAVGRMFVDVPLSKDELGTLAKHSPRSRDAAHGPLGQLSKRERQVFDKLALGHTNQEIANELDVSVKTIETYRSRIGEKLGIRSRADLVRFALELGLLGRDDSTT
ncbi:MAG: response regulator transcription factor [Pirellulales bacterium]